MGCCCKKKKREQLIDKNDPNNSNEGNKKEIEISYPKLSYKDFEPLKLLGTGSFGRVLLVRFISNNQLYAMKILSKNQLKITHQEEHTKTERDLMVKLTSPFLVNIKFAFQDEAKLYIVSDFMQGGDMFYHLHSQNKFPEKKAKFYLIEIILGLEALHKNNMIYRDLKPENILMDSEGHIKLTDFGLSKILNDSDDKAFTLCGTPQYLAPEVLKNTGYDKSVDFWSLGCFFYEMLTGFLPYYIPRSKINMKIFENKVKYPPDLNPIAINFINDLLNLDPNKRLGSGENGFNNIKSHEYFKDINWDKYLKKEIKPPFVPELDDDLDLKYFDKMFTEEPIDSNRPTQFSRPREYSTYKGFTFVANSVNKDYENPGSNISDKISNKMDEVNEENDV